MILIKMVWMVPKKQREWKQKKIPEGNSNKYEENKKSTTNITVTQRKKKDIKNKITLLVLLWHLQSHLLLYV